MVGMPVPLRKTACASGVVHLAPQPVGALGRLLVDVRDVLQTAVAHHVEAMLLQVSLALERDLLAVGCAERDALDAKLPERGGHAAEGRREGERVLGLQALQERGLGAAAERIAGGGVGKHDDVGLHHGEERGAFVDVLDLAAVALLLSVMGSRRSTGDEPREMHRHARRRHRDQFRLDRGVARRDEEPQTRAPSLHDRPPPARPNHRARPRPGSGCRCRP